MPLPSNIIQQMLAAAATAANAEWTTVSNDLKAFAEGIVEDTAQTVSDLETGAITEQEAQVQFDGIADTADMIANFSRQAAQLAAQAAANAAIAVLWAAIRTAAKLA